MIKRLASFFSITLICCATTIYASFEDSISTEDQIQPEDVSCEDPYSIHTCYDYIGYSKMRKDGYKCTKIRYNQFNVLGRAVLYYNPCNYEGFTIEAGYTRAQIYWFKNPYFNQDTFNVADVSLVAFSKRLCNWLWTARVGAGYDVDRNDFTEATAWDILLWGRYERSPCLGVHVGFLAQTGMRIDHLYPIFGFDLKLKDCWTLNAVFPVNMSLLYQIDCNWSAGLAARVFDSRYRLSRHDKTPHGLLTYRATGAEFRMNYQYANRITANLHAGSTFGGELKVANEKYQHKKHFKFNPAAYAGGEFEVSF